MRALRVITITAICALMTTATTTAPLLDVERSNTVSIVAETTSTAPPAGPEGTGSDPATDSIVATTTSAPPPVELEGEQTTAVVEATTSDADADASQDYSHVVVGDASHVPNGDELTSPCADPRNCT